MKKFFGLLIFIVLIASCSQPISSEDLKNINGYWEIEEVKTPDSQAKIYGQNTSVDYIELKNNEGFRQKMMPQFDGKYLTNDLRENIKIVEEKNKFYLDCSTEYAQWREEIVAIDSTNLTIKNDQNITYKYKRFEPLNVEVNE